MLFSSRTTGRRARTARFTSASEPTPAAVPAAKPCQNRRLLLLAIRSSIRESFRISDRCLLRNPASPHGVARAPISGPNCTADAAFRSPLAPRMQHARLCGHPVEANVKAGARNAKVHIGTSGWHYKHWCGPFYAEKLPAAKMLEFYVRHFDTVELNNSFYKLPAVAAFRGWRDSTPPGFCFAVKASRFITHNKKLKDPENALQNFLPRAAELGPKLGPILFQLPPRWRVNVERLEEFLSVLPGRHHYVFELREPTWHSDRVYETLHRHNAALCIFHLAGFQSPVELTADFTYLRLHGPGGKYQGSYSHELVEWAQRIRDWQRKLKA